MWFPLLLFFMEKLFENVALADLKKVAEELVPLLKTKRLVLFYAHMGAGKTTFIRTLCQAMDVVDDISSPTFSIVNEYQTTSGETLFHFDFYRIKSEVEAFDMGYEDYLYSGKICLIESPEKIATLLPEDAIEVHIAGSGEFREIKLMW